MLLIPKKNIGLVFHDPEKSTYPLPNAGGRGGTLEVLYHFNFSRSMCTLKYSAGTR